MAERNLYISTKTGTAIESAAVNGLDVPVYAASLQGIVLGDAPTYNIYLVDGDGGYDSRSGNAGYTPELALSVPGLAPTGGTFILGYGSATSGTLTSGKRYKISTFVAGDDFTNVGASDNVTGIIFTASGTTPTDWTNSSTLIEVTTDLAYDIAESALHTALNLLASITAAGGVIVDGAAPVWLIEFVSAGARTAVLSDGASLLPEGSVVVATAQTGTSAVKSRQSVALVRPPLAVQTSFTPITNGWRGVLSCATYALQEYLGDETRIGIIGGQVLEFKLTDGAGNRESLLQAAVEVRNRVIQSSALVPAPASDYYTGTQSNAAFVQNQYNITGLTGGGASNLDGIATTAITTALVALRLSGALAHYRLEGGTDAESSPDVIRPDDYDGSTNAKVWHLVTLSAISLAVSNFRFSSDRAEILDDNDGTTWRQLRCNAGDLYTI
jgi:hypothetical protein